jgi:hypothetical protein
MAIDIKDNLNNVLSMEMDLRNLTMVIFTKGLIIMVNHKDSANISGKMGVILKDILKMV